MPRGRTWDHTRTEKFCPKCQRILPLDEFNKNKARHDGFASYCKACKYEGYKPHRYTDKKKDRLVAYSRQWRQDNPDKVKAQYHRYYEKNRHKYKAQNELNKAVAKGHLAPQPCEVCGVQPTQAHHWSYEPEHWLDVRWLCTAHHGAVHRKFNRLII